MLSIRETKAIWKHNLFPLFTCKIPDLHRERKTIKNNRNTDSRGKFHLYLTPVMIHAARYSARFRSTHPAWQISTLQHLNEDEWSEVYEMLINRGFLRTLHYLVSDICRCSDQSRLGSRDEDRWGKCLCRFISGVKEIISWYFVRDVSAFSQCVGFYLFQCLFIFGRHVWRVHFSENFFKRFRNFSSNMTFELSLNVFTAFSKFSNKNMWKIGSLNWLQFMLKWFIRFPKFAEFTELLFDLGKTPM